MSARGDFSSSGTPLKRRYELCAVRKEMFLSSGARRLVIERWPAGCESSRHRSHPRFFRPIQILLISALRAPLKLSEEEIIMSVTQLCWLFKKPLIGRLVSALVESQLYS
ncbi:unnamed protein product [Chrysodeixis includens]|uniref:Uncharacterized protein n=1 Tax=Chrysodeixis includens TaxID=689277 RepID=A0A9P0FR07_CHRIL|nr:unnamed protein product [Chrysodeixis includens]